MTTSTTLPSILILCEGNHRRSPMAEALLRARLGSGSRVSSAGLAALQHFPADPQAVALMAAEGLDLTAHRGRQVTAALALAAELILVMDPAQLKWCEDLVPGVRGRVFLLGHWLVPPRNIQDPPPLEPAAFRKALADIREAIEAWLPHLSAPTAERRGHKKP